MTRTIGARANEKDIRLIRFLAAQKKLTVSKYLLRAALMAAKADLEQLRAEVELKPAR